MGRLHPDFGVPQSPMAQTLPTWDTLGLMLTHLGFLVSCFAGFYWSKANIPRTDTMNLKKSHKTLFFFFFFGGEPLEQPILLSDEIELATGRLITWSSWTTSGTGLSAREGCTRILWVGRFSEQDRATYKKPFSFILPFRPNVLAAWKQCRRSSWLSDTLNSSGKACYAYGLRFVI